MYFLAGLALIIIIAIVTRKQAKHRRYWVHPLLTERREKGQFWTLYNDLRKHPDKFFSYARMSIVSFDELLQELSPELQREDTHFRRAVPPCERLLVTLRFLASGQSYSALHLEFRLGKSTIQSIVLSTCKVIWLKLQPNFMRFPDKKKWMEVADLYWRRCNFPHCVGAIDGKHVRMVCPPCSGSNFYNYKKFFSIVLLAIVDADYKFLYIDVGSYGSSCDSAIYNRSKFGRLVQTGRLDLPDPKPLPGMSAPSYPFFFVGDEAFGLSTYIMRPYSSRAMNGKKATFNTRLSRARRMVECTFGILAAKWRIFQTSLHMAPKNAVCVIKAACILHNYVREKEGVNLDESDTPINLSAHRAAPRPNNDAIQMRDSLADYLFSVIINLWRDWYKS